MTATSPALNAAAASTRTEQQARSEWRENVIQRQLSGLKALGLSEEALAREEALLRGGFAAKDVFANIFGARDLVGG